jgi:hypothetical protein
MFSFWETSVLIYQFVWPKYFKIPVMLHITFIWLLSYYKENALTASPHHYNVKKSDNYINKYGMKVAV